MYRKNHDCPCPEGSWHKEEKRQFPILYHIKLAQTRCNAVKTICYLLNLDSLTKKLKQKRGAYSLEK